MTSASGVGFSNL